VGDVQEVGLVKHLSNTRVRGFPPAAGPDIFNAVVTPSLLYGMVQIDTGPHMAGFNGRLFPSRLASVWSSLTKVANAALRVIFPVWRTIPTPWLWWLAGLYPEYLLDRERVRWRNRIVMLPASHPLWISVSRK